MHKPKNKRKSKSSIGVFPNADYVAVIPIIEDKSIELLIEEPLKGMVVGTGPGTHNQEMDIELGAVVHYMRNALQTRIEIDKTGKDYVFIRRSDIVCSE